MEKTEVNKSKKIIVIILTCLVWFLLAIILGKVGYETNDDETMNLLIAGIYGDSTPYLVFINYVYASFLVLLQKLIGGINWYLTVQLLLNFFSIISISYLVTKKLRISWAIFITLVINLVLYYDFYNNLQFTKNAFLYCGAGYLWLLEYYDEKSFKSLVYAMLFISIGSMVRFHSFVFTVPFILVVLFLRLFGKNKKELKKYFKKLIISMMFIFIPIGIAYGVNKLAYSGEDWQKYLKFNTLRSHILDYPMPSFEEYRDRYKEIGISDNDYNLIHNWDFIDFNKYSIARLQKVVDLQKEVKQESKATFYNKVTNSFSSFKNRLFYYSPISLALVFVLAATVFKRNKIILGVIYFFVVLSGYYFLVGMGRVLWRVEIGLWLIPCLIMLYEFKLETSKNKYHKIAWLINLGVCAYFVVSIFGVFTNQKDSKILKIDENYNQFFKEIKKKDKVYIIDVATLDLKRMAPNIFLINSDYKDYYGNCIVAGGWSVSSPLWKNKANKYDVEGFISLIKNDNCYYVDNSGTYEMLNLFLRQNYKLNVHHRKVDTINGLIVWKYYVK